MNAVLHQTSVAPTGLRLFSPTTPTADAVGYGYAAPLRGSVPSSLVTRHLSLVTYLDKVGGRTLPDLSCGILVGGVYETFLQKPLRFGGRALRRRRLRASARVALHRSGDAQDSARRGSAALARRPLGRLPDNRARRCRQPQPHADLSDTFDRRRAEAVDERQRERVHAALVARRAAARVHDRRTSLDDEPRRLRREAVNEHLDRRVRPRLVARRPHARLRLGRLRGLRRRRVQQAARRGGRKEPRQGARRDGPPLQTLD